MGVCNLLGAEIMADKMGWNKKQKRWFIKFDRKQYTISPKQLGTPPTKEASEAKANDWWTQKRAEIEATPMDDLAKLEAKFSKALTAIGRKPDIAELGGVDAIDGLRVLRMVKEDKYTTNKPTAIKDQIQAYRHNAQMEVKATKIKPGRYVKIDNSLKWLEKFIDERDITSLTELNEDFVKTYSLWLTEQQKVKKLFGIFSRRDHWQLFRVWVIDLAERRLIPMPMNILSKKFLVQVPKLKYRYWTREEFQNMYSRTTERNKLFLLLTANCGFYNSDIGCLKKSELDLKKGSITRQRTKTGEELEVNHLPSNGVPVITWYLWPETLKLLKKHLSNDPVLALTNEDGGCLWKDGVHANGKYWKIDNIHTAFSRMVKSLKIEDYNTIENLRKTSAQFLSDSEYRDCVKQFGGWAERDIEKTNYVAVTEERFKKACMWLRGKYL